MTGLDMPRTISVILSGDSSPLTAAYAKAEAATKKWEASTIAAHAKASAASTKSAAEIKADFNSEAATAERSNQRLVASLHAREAALLQAQQAAQKYGKATAFLDRHSATLNKVATGLTGVGVTAGVAFGAAVAAAANFDSAMSKVQAAQGGSSKNMGQLRQAAIKWGQQTRYSATEAADGITQLIKAGVSAKDVLNGGLQGALNLAASGEMAVGEAAEDMASALNQFGLKGRDATHVADLMAAAAGKAQGNVSDMATALKYVGPVAHGMGVSIEETSGAIAELASNGILGDQAGTSLRGMLLSLTSPSKKAADEMEALGINVYDAQGNFVGFNGVAGQLHDRLGKLSNAQRDAALGIIFGNTQVTAARVLYNGGAAAVDKWTKSVNDSGFAQRQAATNMDNLKGDIEQLRGAFETALIGAGEGQQGALRDAVQGLTDLVNAWSDLPDEVKSAVMRVVGVLGILSLGGAGTIKVLQGVAAMRKAMVDMGGASGPIKAWKQLASGVDEAGEALTRTGRAARLAQVGVPLVGIALAGVTTAIGYFQDQQAKEKAVARDFSQAMDTITGKIDNQTAALNKNVQQVAIKNLTDADAYKNAKSLGISYNDVTQAALGNAGAQSRVAAAIDRAHTASSQLYVDTQGNTVEMTKGSKAADSLSHAIFGTNTAMQDGISKARQQRAATDAAARAQRDTAKSAEDLSKRYSLQAINANFAAIESKQLDKDHNKLRKDTEALKDATQKLASAFTILRGGEMDVQEASDQFKDSLHSLTTAEKQNGRSLDDNTAKGRANRQSIRDAISAMNDNITAQFKSESENKKLGNAQERTKKATDDAAKSLRQQKQDLINSAEKAGYNRQQVKKMVDQMVLTPSELKTEVKAFGINKLQDEIDRLQAQIDALEGTHNVKLNYETLMRGREVKLNLNAHGRAVARAAGGPVYGPGTATSDSILTRLSNGEFVIKEASVRKIGIDRLQFMNATGQVPAFRDGGLVNHGINRGGNGAKGDAVVPQIPVTGTLPAGTVSAINQMLNAATNTVGQGAIDVIRQSLGGDAVWPTNTRRLSPSYPGHSGVDIAAGMGAPIYAATPGVITYTGWGRGYGHAIFERLNIGKEAVYGHTSKVLTHKGALVSAAEQIGLVGATGHATGPHLHFEIAYAPFGSASNRAPTLAWLNSIGAGGAAAVAGGGSGQDVARRFMIARYGAGAWADINYIGQHESGWNPHATNPSSGAYGVGQALPASKMAPYGSDYRTNEITQLRWMAAYMDSRYGGPHQAAQFWRSHGWYATGGPVTGPGTGTSDSINARLSNGEYVVNAAATARNRALLDYINFGSMRFASGGYASSGGGMSEQRMINAMTAILDSRPVVGNINGDYNHFGRKLVTELDRQRRSKLHGAGIGVRR